MLIYYNTRYDRAYLAYLVAPLVSFRLKHEGYKPTVHVALFACVDR